MRKDAVARTRRGTGYRVLVRLGDGLARLREDARQFPAHAHVLAGLAREQEREPAGPLRAAEEHVRQAPRLLVPLCRHRRGCVPEARGRVGTGFNDKHKTERVTGRERSPGCQGTEGQCIGRGCLIDERVPLTEPVPQLLDGVGGQRDELRCAVPGRVRGRAGVLLEHGVEITPAEAERADARSTGLAVRAEPRPSLCVEIEGAGVDVEGGIGLADLDRRRQHLVVQGERRLDQSGSTGGGLRVPDLRLDRSERAPGPV